MSNDTDNKAQKQIKSKGFYKIVIVLFGILIMIGILNIAPNYIRNEIQGKTNIVINNNNKTKNLKNDVLIENGVVYISEDDIKNFFDENIYYDKQYNQIVTSSDTKLAALPINSKKITINSSNVEIYASAKKENNVYYLPFSEISKTVYNIETEYKEETDTVVFVSLDRELIYANSSKNNSIKYKPTMFSKTVDKVKKGDNLTVVPTTELANDDWSKVTTENGIVGYVKKSTLVNSQKVRENLTMNKQIEGNISLVWDYFSSYSSAPKREGKIEGVNVVSPTFVSVKEAGKGEISKNIGQDGISYIKWAKNNNYKVWGMVSNESRKDTTSEILNDYKLREKLINNIVDVAVEYNFDGVNIDFENIYEKDKNVYTKFIVELAPRLKELGKVISVDVTAPDGSPDWSLCFNRNVIGKVADYIVFMAYDQNGISSTEAGTTAGCDWVENNINKFINQEEVDSSKIILGMPFYTRIWAEENGKTTSKVVSMKDTYDSIPSGTEAKWLEKEKQYYAEYIDDNKNYKVWIEDKNSLKEKLLLVDKYNLAGASYWEKDRESEEVWSMISDMLKIK